MPELRDPARFHKQMKARQICASCMVRQECLNFALENRLIQGVWGGTTERERAYLQREFDQTNQAITYTETEAA